jgi:hypothetical protein
MTPPEAGAVDADVDGATLADVFVVELELLLPHAARTRARLSAPRTPTPRNTALVRITICISYLRFV